MFRGVLIAATAIVALIAAALWWTHRDLPAEALEREYVRGNDRFVEAAGLRVRVREDGPENAPVLLLAHGFTDSLETWELWADELDAAYRVVRVDMPGHGLTGPDPEGRYAPDDLGAFLGAVMDALGIERAHVGGNSMGGLAAWRLAAARPDKVETLVLLDPAVYPLGDDLEVPLPAEIMFRMAPQAGVDLAYDSAVADDAAVTPQMRARARAMWRRDGNGGAMVTAMRGFDLGDSGGMLGAIETPTLILWGDQDQVVPLEHGERMAEAMPNAELIVYEGLGHMPQLEAPALSAADVRSFLESR